jgi:hypothetical protein
MESYKLSLYSMVQRLSDNAFIPFDPANTDYQEYLKLVAEGNEPLPADEPASQPADEV